MSMSCTPIYSSFTLGFYGTNSSESNGVVPQQGKSEHSWACSEQICSVLPVLQLGSYTLYACQSCLGFAVQ